MSIKAQNTRFFQPTAIAGCQVWFDGADPLGTGIPPANSASISTWTDKSVNRYNATPSSGRIAGTFSSAFNCVYFQSSNVGYQTSYSANPTNETMFIVANIDSPVNINNNTIIGGQLGARSFGFGYAGGGGGTGYSSYLNNEVAWQNSGVTGPSAGVTALITGTVTTTTNVAVALNGSTFTTGTVPSWSSGTTTYLGVDTTTTQYYYVGYVMEIIFYNSVLNSTQQKQIEGYLAYKWGLQRSLPATHTFSRTPYFATSVYFPKAIPTIIGTNLNSPLAIAGLSLWLDGQDILGTGLPYPIGATVTTWIDKSPFANSTTSRAGSSTYLGAGLGAYPAPYFLGSASPIYFLGGFSQTFSGTQMNCFAVASLSSGAYSAYGRILALARPSANDYGDTTTTFPFIQNNATQALIIGRNSSYLSTSIPAYGTPFIVQSSHNGVMEYIGVNGNLTPASQNTGIATGFNITSYGIGTNPNTTDAGSYWTGFIGEVIVFFGVALTTAQVQAVEGYLAWKWGLQGSLASGHPYQTVPPISPPYRNPVTRNNYNTRFNPTSIGGCRLWLDAIDSSTITGTTNVTAWRDKSSSLTLTGSGSIYTTVNGYPTITFNGNQYASSTNLPYEGVCTSDANFTTFMVQLTTSSSGVNGMPFTIYLTGNVRRLAVFSSGGGSGGIFVDGASQASPRLGGITQTLNTPQLLTITRKNITIMTARLNGSQVSSADFPGTTNFISSSSYFVYISHSTGLWSGNMYEILHYNRDISDLEIQQVEGYLAWKWGLRSNLPTTHPYYNFPPSP